MMELTAREQQVLDLFMIKGSAQAVAQELGVTRSSVRSHIKRAEAKGLVPWLEKMPVSDSLTLQKTTVHIKDGQVVQEWRRLIPGVQELEDLVEAISDRVRGRGRAPARKARKTDSENGLYEIDIYDPHIGMYASARETGDQDYNTDMAARRMVQAVEELASRSRRPERAVLVLGGDILHADNRSNQTEKSHNTLDTDTRYFRTIDYVARACTDCVEITASIARSLDVVVIPGNHDYHSCLWLHQLLTMMYENCPNVRVLQQDTMRKHMVWGQNLLVWAHGDSIPANKWAQVVAAELAPEWGRTSFRHLKLGHVHHRKTIAPVAINEQAGLLVEYLPALCPSDAWHAGSGYVGTNRGASAFAYDARHGLQTSEFHKPLKDVEE